MFNKSRVIRWTTLRHLLTVDSSFHLAWLWKRKSKDDLFECALFKSDWKTSHNFISATFCRCGCQFRFFIRLDAVLSNSFARNAIGISCFVANEDQSNWNLKWSEMCRLHQRPLSLARNHCPCCVTKTNTPDVWLTSQPNWSLSSHTHFSVSISTVSLHVVRCNSQNILFHFTHTASDVWWI